jgi:nicotinate phosphoribosyltransferase
MVAAAAAARVGARGTEAQRERVKMLQKQALLTDLYQLTMAQAYWRTGLAKKQASFYMHFRENPFKGGYALACGLAQLAEFIEGFSFTERDCKYLKSLQAGKGTVLLDPEFVDSLGKLHLELDIDAVPEGTVVFPYEPIVRVSGPILQCQIIETALLNHVGYQTLIATKAARVCQAAGDGAVAEFGLRRAQGPCGGVLASRAAIIGGCSSTSNVEAGRLFDLPVSGTHAHSWVMAHPDELSAFRAFAEVMPENCIFLVDTYDVATGVKNAITVAQEMETRGQRLAGIRIDSGDLAWLSNLARALLDDAGLNYVRIVVSNDLDEYTIQSLRDQGAPIDAWGVGTRLVTAYDQPALGGVYKLSATRQGEHSIWEPHLKVSEQIRKATFPGVLAVRRYYDENDTLIGDMVYSEDSPPARHLIIDPHDELRRKDLSGARYSTLLQPLARKGNIVSPKASVLEAQENARRNLASLDASNKRFLNPHSYPVGLEEKLMAGRDALILRARAHRKA